jgi:AcrR family transcriptional regulator
MQATVGLRERKKEATREALIQGAYQLFEARGFDAVTIDQLAERADISRRTFFRYFPTKEAIVFPRQAERLVGFKAALAATSPDLTGVRGACMRTAAGFADARGEFLTQGRIIHTSHTLIAHEASLDVQWEDAIAAHLDQSLPELQSRYLAGAMMGLVRAVLRSWRERGCADDLSDLGAQAFDLLLGDSP